MFKNSQSQCDHINSLESVSVAVISPQCCTVHAKNFKLALKNVFSHCSSDTLKYKIMCFAFLNVLKPLVTSQNANKKYIIEFGGSKLS